MESHIDTLLLLALPASGKSELRRYLASVSVDVAAEDFGLGPTVQLDDYPYVHMMRRISEELRRLGEPPVFFASDNDPFLEGKDWATLIELINDDYAELGTNPPVPVEPTLWLLRRFDRARMAVGLKPPFRDLSADTLTSLAEALDSEIAELATELASTVSSYQPGVSTVLIELARGGSEGTKPPLADPHGYAYSLRYLSPDILARSTALYVWVTPEESRRRNEDRAKPGLEGDASILHHGVPDVVMRGNYGVDDFLWLMGQGGGNTIEITSENGSITIPGAVFDNRIDHTSFLRADEADWDPTLVEDLHTALTRSFAQLNRL